MQKSCAIARRVTWEGYPERAFTETKKYLFDNLRIYEWRAAISDLVVITDYMPVVTE